MRCGPTSGFHCCRSCCCSSRAESSAAGLSSSPYSARACLDSTGSLATSSFRTSGPWPRSASSFWVCGRIGFSARAWYWRMGMPLNPEVSFTWIVHGTWKVRSAKGKDIYIDPWVMNNPVAPAALKKVDGCDLMLITHGHFDHVHDALEIAKATNPKIVTNFEIGAWLGSKGVDGNSIMGINTGGTGDVDGIKVTLVQ